MMVEKDAISESLETTQPGGTEDGGHDARAMPAHRKGAGGGHTPPSGSSSSRATAASAPVPGGSPALASSAFSKPIGTKTLFGVGIAGLSLPGAGKGALVSAPPAAARSAASTTPDFLSEVSKALDDQAAEARGRALDPSAASSSSSGGRARDSAPPSGTNGAAPEGQAATMQISSWVEAPEFEDPDDGPTSLTPGIISITEDVPAARFDLATPHVGGFGTGRGHETEEPVVLGPPTRSSFDPESATASVLTRSTGWEKEDSNPAHHLASAPPEETTPPDPAASAATFPPELAPGWPRPGAPVSAPTLPASPRISADGRSRSLSFGTAARDSVDGRPLAVPASITVRTRSTARASTGEVHLLRSYIKVATTTLAGMIGATFIGGLAVGILVGRGRAEAPALAPPLNGSASAGHSVGVGSVAAPHPLGPTVTPIAPAGPLAPKAAPGSPPELSPVSPPAAARVGERAFSRAPEAVSRVKPAPIVAPLPRAKASETVAVSPPAKANPPRPVAAGTTSSSAAKGKAPGNKAGVKTVQGKRWHDPFAD